jgi:hypothetical protein
MTGKDPEMSMIEPTFPTPDLAEAKRFLALLDPSPAAAFGFATVDDDHERSDYKLALRLYGDLDQALCLSGRRKGEQVATLRALTWRTDQGAGVFVSTQALDGHGVTGKHVNRIRSFHGDADTDLQRLTLGQFIQTSGLIPSFMVASGGLTASGGEKVQAYWLVCDCPVDRFETIQAELLEHTGTDPAAKDLARIFRLPGFWHQKRQRPRGWLAFSAATGAAMPWRRSSPACAPPPRCRTPWAIWAPAQASGQAVVPGEVTEAPAAAMMGCANAPSGSAGCCAAWATWPAWQAGS